MADDDQVAVVDGRRWAVTAQSLASVRDDPRWQAWDGKPPHALAADGPVRVFEFAVGRSFDTQRAIKDALWGDGFSGVPSAVVDAVVEASFMCPASVVAPGDAEVPLYRTVGGGKLHLPDCPHVRAVDIIEASPDERRTMPVCLGWCNNELQGFGRKYHESIEAALEDMGAPHHARAEIARLLRETEYDTVFVPNSRSYVAVSRGGRGVAWAGKTYVDYIDRPIVYLPDYEAGGGGGPERNVLRGDVCPIHGYERSLTGVCFGCE